MTSLLSALLALYICRAIVAATLEPHVPDCYRGCLRNTTNVRDDCDVRDTECVCTHGWITKAVTCCFARDCEYKDRKYIDEFIMATCKGKVTNIPLRSAIYCYAAWCKEAETAVVTIPPYTGETATTNTSAPTSTPTTGATFTVGATNTTGATNVTGATITTRVTITDIVSPVTKTNGLSPPMAPFNGVSMFTGSCTSPNIALASASAGANLTAYPWMGCSQEHHDCCAFSGDELMSLTICPHDYTTTSSACCPSKWKIYTTNLGGQTPCYSSLDMGLAQIPTDTDDATFITDLAFTMKYGLATKEVSRLSSGAMARVIIGSVIGGICFMGVVGQLLLRRRRSRRRATALNPSSGATPLYPDVPSPQELPGSTFLHENHPAFNPSRH